MSQRTGMRLSFFGGLRPFSRSGAVRDALAGVTLASMNIPQVLGYTRIAATPVVTGLYTVLLPLVNLPAPPLLPVPVRVTTEGITTIHHFSIPIFTDGQQEFYTVTPLTGTAS